MNDRIKELHDKAFDGIDILEANWFLKHNKKFAELIVRECANRASWAQDTNEADIGGEVLKHFGVEK
jgi:hypothetical protein